MEKFRDSIAANEIDTFMTEKKKANLASPASYFSRFSTNSSHPAVAAARLDELNTKRPSPLLFFVLVRSHKQKTNAILYNLKKDTDPNCSWTAPIGLR